MEEFNRERATEWWKGLDARRRTVWAPVLKAMTEEQRATFHKERLDAMARFLWPADSGLGDHERAAAEALTLAVWVKRIELTVEVPPASAFLTDRVAT